MRIGIPLETRPGERRVAGTPDTVERLVAAGAELLVERGAGVRAAIADADFERAGAAVTDRDQAWAAEVVLKVEAPSVEEAGLLGEGATVVGFARPARHPRAFSALLERGATVVAMEAVPRIARAQKMDALSSMANLAGYKAILEAANAYGRFFPLLMTAAGTITPAQVMVIGAGVAGLSAIATARRLGAVVRAFDVRPAAADQVRSLGARFLDMELDESAEDAGGYASGITPDFIRREMELLAANVREVDVVVTTALVAGGKAPVLVTEDMVRSMRPGSVVADLAVEQGGNCSLSSMDGPVDAGGVTVLGLPSLPSRMPIDASRLYARNVLNLLQHLAGKAGLGASALEPDLDDPIAGPVTIASKGRDRRPSRGGATSP